MVDPEQPCPDNHVRVVCISDTHGLHGKIKRIPPGDILIHSGDFSSNGGIAHVQSFERWFSALPHTHKIVIAGNHEITFQPEFYERNWQRFHHKRLDPVEIKNIITESQDITYLEDSMTIAMGLCIYGSPWQPAFCNWAFNLKGGEAAVAKWDEIPEQVDVLVTHGPPFGIGDQCLDGSRAGCRHLLSRVQVFRPKYHVFGHIHEGYGVFTDGATTFVNASTCTAEYEPTNVPIVFDIKYK